MNLHCCGCGTTVAPVLTYGAEVYPSRKDLAHLPFWKCEWCGNHVGCHKGTRDPLGFIATKEMRQARVDIHRVLDPLWKEKKISRGVLYRRMAKALGQKYYHTAELRSLEHCAQALLAAIRIRRRLTRTEDRATDE